MSFWDHLEDLRKSIIRVVLAVVGATVFLFLFKNFLFDGIILAPADGKSIFFRLIGADFSIDLVNLEVAAQFMIHMKVTFYTALILVFPYIIFEVWKFIVPALYENERRAVRGAFSFASLLFYLGVSVGYLVVFPVMLYFFANYQVSADVPNTFSLSSYISLMVSTVLAFGLVLNVGNIYYHGYNARTTISGGKVTVGNTTILRYNDEVDAGIYIYGDADASTVEFDCDYYVGAYSGTFYAVDANIECGYFLLKNSYDADKGYTTPINMTLSGSTLTVAGTTDGQDSFITDGCANLTLTNKSSINDVRDFNILAGAELTLEISRNSALYAENASIPAELQDQIKTDGNKVFYPVAKIGENYFQTLQEAVNACVAGDNVVTLLVDCDETVTVKQQAGVNVVIDGDGHTFTGSFKLTPLLWSARWQKRDYPPIFHPYGQGERYRRR